MTGLECENTKEQFSDFSQQFLEQMLNFLKTKLPVHLVGIVPGFDSNTFLKKYTSSRKIKVPAKQIEPLFGRIHILDDEFELTPGTVLVFYRYSTPVFHSGLYLGKDRVMHTAIPNGTKSGDFLTICNIRTFMHGNEDLVAINTSLMFMSDQEFKSNVVNFTNQVHEYSLSKNNCEHLAFQAMSGF
jgi:cell wall-associated NlpC family hydrolase